tara:strand:- start:9657 stop:10310 length:654 start_codon:yes stop_codon:yes gene_type:complete
MTTIVEICNDALSNIRAQSINSLNENSLQAQYCKLKYPIVLDKVLRERNWSFATTYWTLAKRTEKLHNWLFTYAHPVDCLSVQQIVPLGSEKTGTGIIHRHPRTTLNVDDRVPFAIASVYTGSGYERVIGCDTDNAVARLTHRANDPNVFDPIFKMMLAWYLSSQLAVPLLGDGKGRQVKDIAMREYMLLRSEATQADFDEDQEDTFIESELISGRQ